MSNKKNQQESDFSGEILAPLFITNLAIIYVLGTLGIGMADLMAGREVDFVGLFSLTWELWQPFVLSTSGVTLVQYAIFKRYLHRC